MTDFFQQMNEDYVKKHFPNGSVFEGAIKTTKRRSIGGIFFLSLFMLGGLFGLVWSIDTTMHFVADGQDDMLGIGIGICVFFGLVFLGFLALLIYMIKGVGKTHDDYIADSAKQSKLPEHEIQRFEQQAVSSDSYILKLTAGLDRALSNATNKDGLLTRDYIYLADSAQTVIRIDDLKACCFEDYTYYVGDMKHRKLVHNLAIRLLASNGATVLSDTTEKAGLALMNLLMERNPAIDTNGGRVLPEGAFDDYCKRILGNQ